MTVDDAGGGRVYLVRHGRTSLNADGRLRGHLDPSLDDAGRTEVERLAEALAGLHVLSLRSSPLRRALQTAEAISARTGAPVVEDVALIDRDYGNWAGMPEAEVLRRWGRLDDAPGVESIEHVHVRTRRLLEAQRALLSQGDVVLVAHDAVNRCLLVDLDPSRPINGVIGQRTACWNILAPRDSGGWAVIGVDQKAE